jgi:ribose 1,5-bisphosphokinase PhnN
LSTPPYTASKLQKEKYGFSFAPIAVTAKKAILSTAMGERGRATDTDIRK